MYVADFLTANGYEAIEAATADEAIAVLERRADIGIVFTDVNMPDSVDGLKLVETVRKRWPPVLLIVTSGKNAVSDENLPAGGRYIPKLRPPRNKPTEKAARLELAPKV